MLALTLKSGAAGMTSYVVHCQPPTQNNVLMSKFNPEEAKR